MCASEVRHQNINNNATDIYNIMQYTTRYRRHGILIWASPRSLSLSLSHSNNTLCVVAHMFNTMPYLRNIQCTNGWAVYICPIATCGPKTHCAQRSLEHRWNNLPKSNMSWYLIFIIIKYNICFDMGLFGWILSLSLHTALQCYMLYVQNGVF